jgi:hypothetical protein
MIVREVLTSDRELNNFDYYNDAKDTIAWLKMMLVRSDDVALKLSRDRCRHCLEVIEQGWKNFRLF